MLIEDYVCNRYFGLRLDTVCEPLSCCLGCAWFGTCCACIPIVSLIKFIFILVPCGIVTSAICAVNTFVKTPTDISNAFVFTYNTRLVGPHVKLAIFVMYPFTRLVFPILQFIVMTVMFIVTSIHLAVLSTYDMDQNYFTGGVEQIYRKAKAFARSTLEGFVFKDTREPEGQNGCIDIPFLQIFFLFFHFLTMFVMAFVTFSIIFPVISFLLIPWSLYHTCKSLINSRRIGPNLKFLLTAMVFPFFVIFPIILCLGGIIANCFYGGPAIIHLLFENLMDSYENYEDIYTLVGRFFLSIGKSWEKYMEIWGEVLEGYFSYHTDELYNWLLEYLVEFDLPAGDEPFDIPLIKVFISLFLAVFSSLTLSLGVFPFLTVLKFFPNMAYIYYYCYYKFYIEWYLGGIINLIKNAIECGGVTRKYCDCSKGLVSKLYSDFPKIMIAHILECLVLTSWPLGVFFVGVYIPFMIVFPVLYIVGTVLLVVLVVLIYVVGFIFTLILPVVMLILPALFYVLFWIIIFLGCIFYGMKGAYFSYKGDNFIEYFSFPVYFVFHTLWIIDYYTNGWLLLDQDGWSIIPCFRVDRDILNRMDYN